MNRYISKATNKLMCKQNDTQEDRSVVREICRQAGIQPSMEAGWNTVR